MSGYKIAHFPGDGIGKEVSGVAKRVIDAVLKGVEWVDFPFGAEHYLKTGEILPESAFADMSRCDAMLFGAIGDPQVKPGVLERGILLEMRFRFDQYINLRPARSFPNIDLPVKCSPIDSVVVRENTEDFYMGIGGFSKGRSLEEKIKVERGLYKLDGAISLNMDAAEGDFAAQVGVLSRAGISRAARYAFNLAKKRGEPKVVLASKANAVPFLYGFLDDETKRVAREEFPDMTLALMNVDAMCYNLVRRPSDLGVILCPNLFGDILSDLQAGLIGGLGLAGAGNIGAGLSMFEPIHGSAPDIAGTGKANPIAAILSAAMLLDHIGEADAAALVNCAVKEFFERSPKNAFPIELGGCANTDAVGDSIISVCKK